MERPYFSKTHTNLDRTNTRPTGPARYISPSRSGYLYPSSKTLLNRNKRNNVPRYWNRQYTQRYEPLQLNNIHFQHAMTDSVALCPVIYENSTRVVQSVKTAEYLVVSPEFNKIAAKSTFAPPSPLPPISAVESNFTTPPPSPKIHNSTKRDIQESPSSNEIETKRRKFESKSKHPPKRKSCLKKPSYGEKKKQVRFIYGYVGSMRVFHEDDIVGNGNPF